MLEAFPPLHLNVKTEGKIMIYSQTLSVKSKAISLLCCSFTAKPALAFASKEINKQKKGFGSMPASIVC